MDEHQKTLRAFPAWLAPYPGAQIKSPVGPCKRKLGDPPALCATLETADSPELIWKFYQPMIEPNGFHFLRSGTNLDIFSSAILTVRVEAVNPRLREAVLISGNRLMSKTVTLHMKWSQLPPLIDIPDPDERSFDERVRQNRELQGLPPSKLLPPVTTPRRRF